MFFHQRCFGVFTLEQEMQFQIRMCCLAQAALLQVLFIKFVPGLKCEEQGKRLSRTNLVSLSIVMRLFHFSFV